MHISIIGAGPIGCYCGYLLAKAGYSVDIYEEHAEIGLPIQCTGLLTRDFDQLNLLKESFLVNTFQEVEVNSPDGQKIVIPQTEYLVDRHKFDQYFAELARKAGAKIYLRHSFVRKEGKELLVKELKKNQELRFSPEIVIAADGPLSKTAHAYGFYHPQRQNYYGIQAIVEGKFNPQRYQTFFGREVCPDLFGWIVPESKTRARVGVASRKDAKKWFDTFVQKQGFKIKETQAGVIPLYHPKQKLKIGNCYLLGDASGFVKATTLGGIIPGMKQAEILADCIANGKDYERATKSLRRKMNLHLRLRNVFDKFEDKDWDKLIKILGKPKMQRLLEQHTRENPLPLVVKALLNEPRLLYFGKFLV
jgi:geranylgeranyl reductase family protein